jgi:methylmalonyl-CoA/ethylmalonyl-CoA epimerase
MAPVEALQAGEPSRTVACGHLHHIGFVVSSIAAAVAQFSLGMPLSWDGQVYYDPVQTVRVTFLAHGSPEAPLIELVEPVDGESRVARFLKRGGGLHHLCYEVAALEPEIERSLAAGAILVADPAAAVAFQGRRIAWICTPDRLLIEYLEHATAYPQPKGGAAKSRDVAC